MGKPKTSRSAKKTERDEDVRAIDDLISTLTIWRDWLISTSRDRATYEALVPEIGRRLGKHLEADRAQENEEVSTETLRMLNIAAAIMKDAPSRVAHMRARSIREMIARARLAVVPRTITTNERREWFLEVVRFQKECIATGAKTVDAAHEAILEIAQTLLDGDARARLATEKGRGILRTEIDGATNRGRPTRGAAPRTTDAASSRDALLRLVFGVGREALAKSKQRARK